MKASVVHCAGIKSNECLESVAQTIFQRIPRLKSVRTVLVIFQELRTVYMALVSTLSLMGYRKQWKNVFLLPILKLMEGRM